MNSDFTLYASKFVDDAEDYSPELKAKYCKWFEDMLMLKNPKFNKLTYDSPQEMYYKTGVIKSMGWMYTSLNPVRVFVCEYSRWNIRYVPTKELAEQYIRKYSGPGTIFWFFYDINMVNMIESE